MTARTAPHAPVTPSEMLGTFRGAIVGDTEAVIEFMGLARPPQHNEHCKGYQFFQYMADCDKRMEAVREEARKIIAARRAREDEIELATAAE